jgi:hypothetical protein
VNAPLFLRDGPDCEKKPGSYPALVESASDVLKFTILVFLFFLAAPVAGFFMRGRPRWQRITFFLICFLTIEGIFEPGEWGLTIDPILYRGHSRGFHFYLIEVVATALFFAQLFGNWRKIKLLPPGLGLYFVYCGLSFISIINAPEPVYVLMAALKAVKISIIFVAAYNFLQTDDDLQFFLSSMAVTITWELVAVMKMKYVGHIYQVPGTFEHQNALAMFVCMIGMLFLAVGLGPKGKHSNFLLFAYVACAAMVQATLSRGALVMFAVGTIGVVVLSLIDGPTKRRLGGTAVLAAIGAFGILMTFNTIVARFHDYGNDESKRTRTMLNAASREMLRDYPLGIGWNNFARVINKPFPYGDKIDDWQRANGNPVDPTYQKGVVESVYWLILAETGYQTLICYILLMSLFLFWNLRAMLFFRHHMVGCVSLGIAMGCGINYIQSTLERVLTQPRNLMLWMLMLATTAKIESWRKVEAAKKRNIQKSPSRVKRKSPAYQSA